MKAYEKKGIGRVKNLSRDPQSVYKHVLSLISFLFFFFQPFTDTLLLSQPACYRPFSFILFLQIFLLLLFLSIYQVLQRSTGCIQLIFVFLFGLFVSYAFFTVSFVSQNTQTVTQKRLRERERERIEQEYNNVMD